MTPIRVLFVCTGNICRSPTAEGVARVMAQRQGLTDAFEFDSAGTHDYHVGDPPDPRTVAAAARRGYDLSRLRARLVTSTDYAEFDHIFAMDSDHLRLMRSHCPPAHQHKLALFMSGAIQGADVPDPYYEGPEAFELVLDLVEQASTRMLERLRPRQDFKQA